MAADISFGFGPAATSYLASSRVGQGFIRAYAKVYNSKYNTAIYATKTPLTVQAGAGASHGAPLETRLRANMKRVNPDEFSSALKGEFSEARTSLTLRRAGFEELPARLKSNNGFDGVWIRKNADGEITDLIITESKFSSTGRAYLPQTATKGQQLSEEWIEKTIKEMLKQRNNAAVRKTALEIQKF